MQYTTTLNCNNIKLKVNISETNIHIEQSYKVTDIETINAFCKKIRALGEEKLGLSYSRSLSSWVNEWKAHNWLYKHNKYTDRTASTDINDSEKLSRRFGYWFISNFLY